MISGGLDFWNNQWAGPAGMGPPHGRNNWITMVHDFNFEKNDRFAIRDYFNPLISKSKSLALRQANSNLIRNGRGIQGIKFALFFGFVNAYQFYVQSFKNK